MNPYKVLGVSPYSSKDERKHAYTDLIKKYHPDNAGTANESMLAEVIDAWEMVKDKSPKQIVYRVSVYMTQKKLAETLGKTLDIEVDNMLLSIKVPFNFRMGDTITMSNNDIKLSITIKEENER